MSYVTLAFYKGAKSENPHARPFDRLTCWRTRSRFSHCELVVVQDIAAGISRCYSSSLRDNGVRAKLIDLKSGRWVLVQVPDLSLKDAVKWFELHQGAPYDWFGLLGWVFPWRVSNRAWWFCSEACAEALGLLESWKTSPGDLYATALHLGGREVTP